MRTGRAIRQRWPLAVPLILFYLPVGYWWTSVGWGEARSPAFSDCLGLVLHTLILALGAGGIATAGGALLGVAFEVYVIRGRALLRPVLLLPLLLPAVVMTPAAQALIAAGPFDRFSRGSLGAIVLTAWTLTPLVFWGVSRAVSGIPRAERLAMTQGFGVHTMAWRLIVPRILPTAVRLGLLATLLAFPALEIPEFAGVETIGVRILGAFTALESDAEGWLLVGMTIAVLTPLTIFAVRPLAHLGEPPVDSIHEPVGDRTRWPVMLPWLFAAVSWVPLVALIETAFDAPMQAGEIELMTTTLVSESVRALIVAVIVVLFGFRVAEIRGWLPFLVVAPLMLLPGSLVGLAWVSIQHFLPTVIVESTLPMSIAQGLRFSAIGVLFGWLALRSIPRPERQAAAWMEDATRRYRVQLGRSLPVLGTGVLLIFVLVLGEVECAHLLSPPGYLPPVLALYQMLHFRFDEQAAQVSLSLVAVSSLVVLALMRWGRGFR